MSQPQPPGQGVIVVDTPSNRRGKFSREDASTYPENIEPKLASMVPEPSKLLIYIYTFYTCLVSCVFCILFTRREFGSNASM